MGTALRKLKKKKGLSGKGKLTDAIIDKLKNYYGIAIRSNVGNLGGMKKAIYVSLMHCETFTYIALMALIAGVNTGRILPIRPSFISKI